MYFEVSIESLASDTRKWLNGIFEFIGLSNEELEVNISPEKVHVERWKVEIPKDELKKINKILGPYIDSLGYK